MRAAVAFSSLLFIAALAGCQGAYFKPAGEAPEATGLRLAAWPDREYWSGIVFNGQKIGFSHYAIAPAAVPNQFEVRSDAAFALRFLGFDKRVNLKAYDLVSADLDLVAFDYDYVIDGNRLALAGRREGNVLDVTITRGSERTNEKIPIAGRLYPQAATALYAPLHGLASGREFRYDVYSGELMKVVPVVQRVGTFEKSPLFEGEAFRVETTMEGYRVEAWLSARGAPMLEIAMNGVLISGLESEIRAKSYLTAASFNKAEALVEFALVRTDRPLAAPRRATKLELALSGVPRVPPSDDRQRCAGADAAATCTIETKPIAAAASSRPSTSPAASATDPRYLASTFQVAARDPAIRAQARAIAEGFTDPAEQVQALVAWIGANIRTSPADAWTAQDVLATREAECQGHAMLYAAFARALGIPTRVANGLVYSEDFGGFLYHAWDESFVAGTWLAVDPTFRQVSADATHLKLVEGEALDELAPLVDWMGRVKVRVIAVQ